MTDDADIQTSKVCKRCGVEKPVEAFSPHNRGLRRTVCRECRLPIARANNRSYIEAHPDRVKDLQLRSKARTRENARERNLRQRSDPTVQLKQAARRAVKYAVAHGTLIRPGSCSSCGVQCAPEAHHHDYSQPLAIIWLCTKCHGLQHRLEATEGKPFMNRVLHEIRIGQVWVDRDKRMLSGNRRVRVIDVVGRQRVAYRAVSMSGETGPMFNSKYERFQRNFNLVTDAALLAASEAENSDAP